MKNKFIEQLEYLDTYELLVKMESTSKIKKDRNEYLNKIHTKKIPIEFLYQLFGFCLSILILTASIGYYVINDTVSIDNYGKSITVVKGNVEKINDQKELKKKALVEYVTKMLYELLGITVFFLFVVLIVSYYDHLYAKEMIILRKKCSIIDKNLKNRLRKRKTANGRQYIKIR